MASRTLLRRFINISRRLPIGATINAARPLASILANSQRPAQTCLKCTQIRGLASKPGDGMVINIQDEKDFEDRVINSEKPVVVDFHAGWCGPCKLLGPRLESIIGSKEGKVILAKVDVDEQLELAMKFSISSVPTVLAVKNKNVLDKFVGLQDDDIIETFISRLIG